MIDYCVNGRKPPIHDKSNAVKRIKILRCLSRELPEGARQQDCTDA
jgi:hypothetical protein